MWKDVSIHQGTITIQVNDPAASSVSGEQRAVAAEGRRDVGAFLETLAAFWFASHHTARVTNR